ncbi:hypothetical protein Trydic_g23200 [Trypoxylus dichotomus]
MISARQAADGWVDYVDSSFLVSREAPNYETPNKESDLSGEPLIFSAAHAPDEKEKPSMYDFGVSDGSGDYSHDDEYSSKEYDSSEEESLEYVPDEKEKPSIYDIDI